MLQSKLFVKQFPGKQFCVLHDHQRYFTYFEY